MRRLYILLASTVIATTLIVVATGVSAAPSPHPGPGGQKAEFLALAIAPSLLKFPSANPNTFFPEAEARQGTTLVNAKKQALTGCEQNGMPRGKYYKDDCQGAVWVQNGWLALARELLTKETVPYRYQYAYGGAYGETRNKAIGKAIGNCYDKDPKYENCVLVEAAATDSPFDLKNHDGGAW